MPCHSCHGDYNTGIPVRYKPEGARDFSAVFQGGAG